MDRDCLTHDLTLVFAFPAARKRTPTADDLNAPLSSHRRLSGVFMRAQAQDAHGDTGSPDLCKVLHIEKIGQAARNLNQLIIENLKCLANSPNGS
jgi:hypothetical protein